MLNITKSNGESSASAAIPVIDARDCRAALPFSELIEELRRAFQAPHVAPDRHIHDQHVPGHAEAAALLIPAWIKGNTYGVKIANIFPSNSTRGEPAVNGVYHHVRNTLQRRARPGRMVEARRSCRSYRGFQAKHARNRCRSGASDGGIC